MEPLNESEVRASFVNCSKGEAKRLTLPRDLATSPWEDLDYLGWRDPQSPARGALVTTAPAAGPTSAGATPVGVLLRAGSTAGAGRRSNLCDLCLTPHTGGGVNLMVAPRAGRSGARGNSVGTYICADLACSLYVRGLRRTDVTGPVETLSAEARIARLQENLAAFVRKVAAAS